MQASIIRYLTHKTIKPIFSNPHYYSEVIVANANKGTNSALIRGHDSKDLSWCRQMLRIILKSQHQHFPFIDKEMKV